MPNIDRAIFVESMFFDNLAVRENLLNRTPEGRSQVLRRTQMTSDILWDKYVSPVFDRQRRSRLAIGMNTAVEARSILSFLTYHLSQHEGDRR